MVHPHVDNNRAASDPRWRMKARAQATQAQMSTVAVRHSQTIIVIYTPMAVPGSVIACHIVFGDRNVVSIASTCTTNSLFVPKSVMLPAAMSVICRAVIPARMATVVPVYQTRRAGAWRAVYAQRHGRLKKGSQWSSVSIEQRRDRGCRAVHASGVDVVVGHRSDQIGSQRAHPHPVLVLQ